MLKQKIYFIAGIGTDIGKTYFVEEMLRNISGSQAIKPIISGFSFADLSSDSAKILSAQGLEVSEENINIISPWRFKDPVSAHFAGINENREIDFSEVVDFCRLTIEAARARDEFLFIEGAGGVMSPINFEKNFLDLVAELDICVLLVGANYLGSISHILTAIAALKARNVSVEHIIINENTPFYKKEENDIAKTVEKFTKIGTLSLDKFINNLN